MEQGRPGGARGSEVEQVGAGDLRWSRPCSAGDPRRWPAAPYRVWNRDGTNYGYILVRCNHGATHEITNILGYIDM